MITLLLKAGVKEWIILHFPGGCMAGSKSGEFIVHGSVIMPEAEIVGTTGAGDAFAAGVLYGIHEGWPMKKCLELGVCTAATSLTRAECSDGIKPKEACLELGLRYGYRKLT